MRFNVRYCVACNCFEGTSFNFFGSIYAGALDHFDGLPRPFKSILVAYLNANFVSLGTNPPVHIFWVSVSFGILGRNTYPYLIVFTKGVPFVGPTSSYNLGRILLGELNSSNLSIGEWMLGIMSLLILPPLTPPNVLDSGQPFSIAILPKTYTNHSTRIAGDIETCISQVKS